VVGLAVVPIVRRVRPVTVVVTGLLLAATGYALVLLFTSPTAVMPIVVAFAVLGAGIGAAETISNDLVISTAPPAKAGAASAVSETAYELGAVLGTAVLGAILTASYRAHLTVPAGVPAGDARIAAETLGGAHQVAHTLPTDQATALLDSAGHAFDTGVGITSGIAMILMVVASVLALRTLRPRPARSFRR
jgi:MFS transporter, DHA2 family, multidrug resistance protein